jgi:Cu+-exporting ATPase
LSNSFVDKKQVCYHCGDVCNQRVVFDQKLFCCDGCKAVYELLKDHELCNYYSPGEFPGVSPKLKNFSGRFDYLNDQDISDKLLQFKSDNLAIVIFDLPQMHCSSCVYLLEHLYKLNQGVAESRTDFLKKNITIHFNPAQTKLKEIVELLATLGYEPLLNLRDLDSKPQKKSFNKRVYRIAVAGFCFANIMLLSFPEYFHINHYGDDGMQRVFSWLNLLLAMPVLLFSGSEFFITAWQGIRAKVLNIDFGLALSIVITFSRSVYEIVSGTGAGYLDSMSGIIFFMLIGRYFQDKTHYNLQFDRNYKSFFPISVVIRKGSGEETSVALPQLKVGDTLVIHSQELIPADSRCLDDGAMIDYSFVTGESTPIRIHKGEIIYAGGKQTGPIIACEMLRDVSQSYLTDLWNKDAFKLERHNAETFVQKLGRNFTFFLLFLSVGSFFYWLPVDSARGINALTTVLIVACPCALLLSATFTQGAMMRIFSKAKAYLRNAKILDSIASVDHIVLDKTGTLTNQVQSVHFNGTELKEEELTLIYSIARQSHHPLSRGLADKLSFCSPQPVTSFTENPGKGVEGKVNGNSIRMGSHAWISGTGEYNGTQSAVYVELNGKLLGFFEFRKQLRDGIHDVISKLKKDYSISVLSGDNDSERAELESIFGKDVEMNFFQSPQQKLDYVKSLQNKGHKVLMIGDGLNDSGALQQSDAGISITDDVNNFSPACDAILEGREFANLPSMIRLAKVSKRIIQVSFVISLLYNTVGLSFAVQGTLSPVVAAILMPLSSITIILFTTGMSWLAYHRLFRNAESLRVAEA